MVSKKHDLITNGLSSEVFLLVLAEPDSAWEIARKMEKLPSTDKSKRPSNYTRVLNAATDLAKSNYLRRNHEEKKFYPKIEAIARDIEKILKSKNLILTKEEFQTLKIVMKHRDFLKLLLPAINEKITKEPKGKHEINALDFLSSQIGMIASSSLAYRKLNPDQDFFVANNDQLNSKDIEAIVNECKSLWKKILETPDNNLKLKIKKEMGSLYNEQMVDFFIRIFKTIPDLSIFFMMPESLLQKLASLWQGHEGANMILEYLSLRKS